MKKLGKLEISSKKMLDDEELTTLKGGETMNCCVCGNGYTMLFAFDEDECKELCEESGARGGTWVC